jgi:Bacterial Ig domain
MLYNEATFASKRDHNDTYWNFWDEICRSVSTCKWIFVLAGLISLSCLIGVATTTAARAQTASNLDANGWTVFAPTSPSGAGNTFTGAGTRIIYVSSSTGNNANPGTSAAPVADIATGWAMIRDGHPDWLLLKKGDTWTETSILHQPIFNGVSATQPIVISSYDPANPTVPDPYTGGARPLIQTNSGNPVIMTFGAGAGAGKGDFIAIVGLEFYAYTRDPANPSFGSAVSNDQVAIAWLNPSTYFLLEDCKLSFYRQSMGFQDGVNSPAQIVHQSINLRRNVIVDAYSADASFAEGAFFAGYAAILVQENLFDHNGWNASVGSAPTVFNHNLYIDGTAGTGTAVPGPATIKGNIFSNDASGSQFRSGGTVTNNLFVHNPYPHNFGMPSAFASTISNNVYSEAVDQPITGIAYGWGIPTFSSYNGVPYNIGTVTISNNIIANTVSTSGFGIQLDTGSRGDTVTGNIIFNWKGSPLINDLGTGNTVSGNVLDASGANTGGSPEQFPYPTRSVGSYNGTLGGTATLTAFLTAARAQSKGTWNTALMAAAVNSYIQAGFGITGSTTATAPTANTTPPSVPQGLAATAVSATQVNLAWTASTDNVGVTGYNVFRNGAKVGTTSNTSYQDIGQSAGTAYTYSVSAYDAAGNTSAQSAGVSITTPALLTPPSVSVSSPTNGTTIKGNGSVNIAVSGSPTGAIAALTITLDGNTVATCPNATSCSATVQGRKITQGTHSIGGIAKDMNGLTAKASVSILALK